MTENTSSIPLEIKPTSIIPNSTEQKQASQNEQKKPGFFLNMWNRVKTWWVGEQEEYIDGHGFKHTRLKKKIPLRDQNLALKKEFRYKGGESLAYATQHTPFGRMFL